MSEIKNNLQELGLICPTEEVYHVAGEANVADMATKPGVKLSEIGPKSLWQSGHLFLLFPRDRWPVNQDFVKINPEIPTTEQKLKANVFAALIAKKDSCNENLAKLCDEVRACCAKVSDFSNISIWDSIRTKMDFSDDQKMVLSIIARVVRGWKVMEENVKLDKNDPKAIEMLTVPPRPNKLQFAEKLVLLTAMPETVGAHKEKKLDSLILKYDVKIIVTTGEKSMSSLLGKTALPVLMPTISIRAAHLYMTRTHCGEGGSCP